MKLVQDSKTKNATLCVMWNDLIISLDARGEKNPEICQKYAVTFAENGEPLCNMCSHINNRIILERRRK